MAGTDISLYAHGLMASRALIGVGCYLRQGKVPDEYETAVQRAYHLFSEAAKVFAFLDNPENETLSFESLSAAVLVSHVSAMYLQKSDTDEQASSLNALIEPLTKTLCDLSDRNYTAVNRAEAEKVQVFLELICDYATEEIVRWQG